MKKYQIYSRRWWQDDPKNKGGLIPHPRARKTIIGYASNEEEARAMCAKFNDTHKPGKYSIKAEYSSDY